MKLWIDDLRRPPDNTYVWVKSVAEATATISQYAQETDNVFLSFDHDAGNYYNDGGDYIRVLDWLETSGLVNPTTWTFHIHSMNPVGVMNMRTIIHKNGWREI